MTGHRSVPVPLPLAVWERDGLAAALAKEGLPAADIASSETLFWRFESDALPVGFGGLEILGDRALLRSVVTLPPVRGRGIGSSIVQALETEARIRGAHTIWLAAAKNAGFFAKLGYSACGPDDVPAAVREAVHSAQLADVTPMMKKLG